MPGVPHQYPRLFTDTGDRALEFYQKAFEKIPKQAPGDNGLGKIPPGFTPIFNGKDLAGWHTSSTNHHGNTQAWRVDDGVLLATQDKPGNGGILLTDKKYKNFELYVEVKPDFGCDGGLFLRSNEKGQAYQVMLDYLAFQALGKNMERGQIGGIYGEQLKGVKPQFAEDWEKAWRKDDWNALRARIEGTPPRITVWLNDTKINDWTDTENRLEEGMIALQIHGGKRWVKDGSHRYRHIAIKELK